MPQSRSLVSLLVLATLLHPTAGRGAERAPLLVIVQAPGSTAHLVTPIQDELARSVRTRPLLLQALTPLMQQADDRAGVRARATTIVEEGRRAMVGLDHALAQAKLGEALDLLRSSFVRYYDPSVEAEVHLLLGVVYLEQMARPDLARQELCEVHHLVPSFKLGPHYSPQARAAFEEAGRTLPPPPVPPLESIRRLAPLAGARLALVLTVQGAGEQSLVQGSLFVESRNAYVGVESRLVDPRDAEAVRRQGAALGSQLRTMVEAQLPPLPPPRVIKKKRRPPPPPPPPPWYRRWYAWAGAGGGIVAVTLAIVLPLALRQKTSDGTVVLP